VHQAGVEAVPHVSVAVGGLGGHLKARVVSAEVGQTVAIGLVEEAHLFKKRKKRDNEKRKSGKMNQNGTIQPQTTGFLSQAPM